MHHNVGKISVWLILTEFYKALPKLFLNLDYDIIHWNSAGITEGFSMCGGDFVEVYGDPNQVGKDSELLLLLRVYGEA